MAGVGRLAIVDGDVVEDILVPKQAPSLCVISLLWGLGAGIQFTPSDRASLEQHEQKSLAQFSFGFQSLGPY